MKNKSESPTVLEKLSSLDKIIKDCNNSLAIYERMRVRFSSYNRYEKDVENINRIKEKAQKEIDFIESCIYKNLDSK